MKLHRFIGKFDLRSGEIRISDPELFNQIKRVLRLDIGENVILCDGDLNEAPSQIIDIGRDFIIFKILEKMKNKNELASHTILYCSILKKENFEFVVQKATEIGINEITPLITARTVKLDIRKDRLERIIKEAAEQSGRGIVPVLNDPIDFKDVVKDIDKNGNNYLFDISGIEVSGLKPNAYSLKPISVWVGPEGGWTVEEVELAKNTGFEVLNLGKTTFRAETAAIIGSYIAIHNL